MRHPHVFLAATWLIAAGCAATGSDSKTFGPQFDVDGGTPDGAIAADTGISPGSDASTPTDAGADATPDATSSTDGGDGGCATGRVAILSGSTTAIQASLSTRASAFTTSPLTGSLAAVPAILDAGGAVQAVYRDAANTLQGVRNAGVSWAQQGRIGTRVARDVPALAATGAQIHLVYQDSAAFTYYHGVFGGTTWDAASDPVQGPAPAGQSLGAYGAALVGVGAELVLLNGGSSEGALYTQIYSGAAWAAGIPVAGTAVCGTTTGTPCGGLPGVVKVTGASDVLALHIDKTSKNIIADVRKAADKTWTSTGAIRPTAPIATTMEQISVSPAGTNRVALVFRGTDQKAYASIGDLSAAPFTWSAPVALVATTVTAPPQVAEGACGDDAIAVVVSAGEAKVVRLKGTTWSAAESVPGTTGAVYAGISSNAGL